MLNEQDISSSLSFSDCYEAIAKHLLLSAIRLRKETPSFIMMSLYFLFGYITQIFYYTLSTNIKLLQMFWFSLMWYLLSFNIYSELTIVHSECPTRAQARNITQSHQRRQRKNMMHKHYIPHIKLSNYFWKFTFSLFSAELFCCNFLSCTLFISQVRFDVLNFIQNPHWEVCWLSLFIYDCRKTIK